MMCISVLKEVAMNGLGTIFQNSMELLLVPADCQVAKMISLFKWEGKKKQLACYPDVSQSEYAGICQKGYDFKTFRKYSNNVNQQS